MPTIECAHPFVHSCFSFLRGTAWPEEIVAAAVEAGLAAVALTDRMAVSGAVRFQRRAEALGLKVAVGAELVLEDGGTAVALAQGPRGYETLCRILTRAHLEGARAAPVVRYAHLEAVGVAGLHLLVGGRGSAFGRELLGRREEAAARALAALRDRVPAEQLALFVVRDRLPGNRTLEEGTVRLARRFRLRLLAAHPVEHLAKEDFWVHDLLTCLRLGLPLEAIHPERPLNAERHLKSADELRTLFADRPAWLEEAHRLVAECDPPFVFGRRLYPAYPLPPGERADEVLRRLVYEGAERRYGRVGRRLAERIEHELATIAETGVADYFLLVWDVVRFARARGIRVSGRGSAADSVVSYCLGLTDVDAFGRGLLFERFLNRERAELPDVDLDFDHRRRDEVADYVRRRYGEEHVAAVATFQTFRARSAVREIGKVLGIPAEELDRLAKRLPMGLPADALDEAWERLPELRRGPASGRYGLLRRAAAKVAGLPRHIGTHLGGLVASRAPLAQLAPRQRSAKGVEILPFDKDDVEAMGLLKLDLLSLRTLAVLDDACRAVGPGVEAWIDRPRPAVYRTIARGETIGVFQLESPAQRALQPRLRPRRLDDLVHAVAIIRPGPIKGDMVRPYLERRAGREPVSYLHPRLRPILEKTYGVVLFQEQVIEVARAIAGFTAGEADELRRVMTHARSQAQMDAIGEMFVARAQSNGVTEADARAIFRMLAGYASYGFPEAHAAAFAQIAYRTAHLAQRAPAAYFAALLSHQPMGYYPPHTLVAEARRRGVRILPPDVQRSRAACSVEGGAIRIGLGLVVGLGAGAEAVEEARRAGPFRSLADFRRRVPLPRDAFAALVLSGALDSLHPNRRAILLAAGEDGLFPEALPSVPDFPEPKRTWLRESVLPLFGPSLWMRSLRPALRRQGVLSTRAARRAVGRRVRVAGVPLRPHRPPTRSGRTVVFFSLEDEFGLLDVTMFEEAYQLFGQHLFAGRVVPLLVTGTVEDREGAMALRLEHLRPLALSSDEPLR